MDRRTAMSSIAANRELDGIIRDGEPVDFIDVDGQKQQGTVKLIDFDNKLNKILAVSQLWIKSTGQSPLAAYRRPDVILYINGLPLVFIELKNSNVKLRSAYDDNLKNFRNDIPQLFHCNAFCILSNAIETKVGSFTAGWEYFFNWFRKDEDIKDINRQKIANEGTSLEYAVDGLCQPADAQEMRKFLGQNKKIVFTLIQKFRYDNGKKYPHLFDNSDREIIVMVDEAHRTQYKNLAENMRISCWRKMNGEKTSMSMKIRFNCRICRSREKVDCLEKIYFIIISNTY